MLFNYLIL